MITKKLHLTSIRLFSKAFLLVFLVALSHSSALYAQDEKPRFFPNLFGLNKSVSFGLMGAGLDGFEYGAIGINATAYGIYLDVMGWPHKSAKDVNTADWQEISVFATHIGYQIPFHYYSGGSIRLTPMIGYYAKKEAALLYEDKTTTATTGHFDYGAALVFQNTDNKIGHYTFSLGCTRYAIWLGFGYEIPLGKEHKL